MSDTYTKLFSSITESTIVSEPVATRWLWVTMLAMADAGGCVYGSVPGLARRANITLQETEAALATFYAPDPYSRTKDHEGRRIVDIDGGWRLLNHGKYAAIRSEAERAEYKRQWDREHRPSGHQRAKQSDSSPTVRQKSDTSPTKSDSPTPPTPTPTLQKEQRATACAEPSDEGMAPEASGESPVVIHLTLNTGAEYPITEAQVCEFASLYPAVDVMQQLRAMRGWCMTNPTKRKTRGGVLRFVNKWLGKAQDDAKESPHANRIPSRKLSAVEQVQQAIDERNRDRDGGLILEGSAVRIAAR